MALVPSLAVGSPLIAEVDMGGSDPSSTVRATVVQASTVFYDTPATLGNFDVASRDSFFLLVFRAAFDFDTKAVLDFLAAAFS
ncbi:hypothetical protein GW17_00053743 [Ensete ventricosum]|nr:hypothetical protein GW17_00053743 [Ensete ventricosum]